MKMVHAADFGLLPGRDIAEKLSGLLKDLSESNEETTLYFQQGTYYINAHACPKHTLYITNTVADDEFSEEETPHLQQVAFYLKGAKHLTIDGAESIFMIDGRATHFALEDCEDITLKNIELRTIHPPMHDLRVTAVNLFSVDFLLDSDTLYTVEKGRLYFYGNGYHVRADKDASRAFWIARICQNTPELVKRNRHPLADAGRVEDLHNGCIRVHYLNTARFHVGDCYTIYDVRRQYVGIFLNRCRDIQLDNIKQRHNESLALVVQDSENITLSRSEFAPEPGCVRQLASAADFMQFCMCRGKITIQNCRFKGAGDDCLNVHGIHFLITEVQDNYWTVRFMHPQTHGFNPLREGDTVALIHPQTLLEFGRATILSSKLISETEILLCVDHAADGIKGAVIENISACPDLFFHDNTLTKIITRGLLITTRGKVEVKNNHFVCTAMSGILLSDDAKSWYESGMCQDVLIQGNRFAYCGETPILIKPENNRHEGAVHRNITIIDNSFEQYPDPAVVARSTDNLTLSGNRLSHGSLLKTEHCTHVKTND